MWRVKSTCARFGTAAISLDLIRESSQERSSLQVVSVSCLCKLSLQRDCCKEIAAEKRAVLPIIRQMLANDNCF